MHPHIVLGNAEGILAGIGGEFLSGSGFENEEPDGDFTPDIVPQPPGNCAAGNACLTVNLASVRFREF
jgi:hypothetical protein